MSEQVRTLVLLRHGKSAYPPDVGDHDRPLAPRGVREAGLAGDWLRANVPAVDAVLCSTATRTRETLARTGVDAPVHYVDRLYGATPATVIEEINRVDDGFGTEIATLLVVGHEPTISQVALGLAGTEGTNPTAAELVSTKFPTSALAVLRFGGLWNDLQLGTAALVSFYVPR